MNRWNEEKAWEWYASVPFPFGCNFLPSTAVNSTEMWQADSFDVETIDKELQFAAGLGYNTVRVFMPFIVWDDDPKGLKERMARFLLVAAKAGITVMPIIFDDCAFAGREPYLGKQDDPAPGIHNSQWTPSPGPHASEDKNVWPRLEEYAQDLISTYGKDPRILCWDLYNEPGNSGRREKSLPLLNAVFKWARESGPTQPITAGSWDWGGWIDPISFCCEERSDIVSFHCYNDLQCTSDVIDTLAQYNRPLLCTEWLHRPRQSRFSTHLPFFSERKVGIYNWGLALGKTQTNLHWATLEGATDADPEEWQHDLIYPDGTLYDSVDTAAIRQALGEDLTMSPVEMTPRVMQDLEERGLIIRLRPGGHELPAGPGETLGESLYESADEFGPHKLIAVTVNREEFAGFGTHPDNEEFLLIGDAESKPMYLAVALCLRNEFEEKVKTGTLKPEDLVLLQCKYNDPDVCFFVMLKDVPHGEAIVEANLPPATFYVTESRDLPLDLVEMRKYRLTVERS